jgi:hypothetical protein
MSSNTWAAIRSGSYDNHRLINCVDSKVRFHWKDYRHASRQKVMLLDVNEFIHRFLLHILPSGFQRIRHYGLFANRYRAVKLARCRQLLAAPRFRRQTPPMLRWTIATVTNNSLANRCVIARSVVMVT